MDFSVLLMVTSPTSNTVALRLIDPKSTNRPPIGRLVADRGRLWQTEAACGRPHLLLEGSLFNKT